MAYSDWTNILVYIHISHAKIQNITHLPEDEGINPNLFCRMCSYLPIMIYQASGERRVCKETPGHKIPFCWF